MTAPARILPMLLALEPEERAEVFARLPPAVVASMAPQFCRESFAFFIKQAWPYVPAVDPLVWGWHLDAMALHYEAVARGEIKKLVINIGPGHAKPCYIGSMVLERLRGRVELSSVVVGDEVLTHRGRFRRVLAVHDQGVLSTVTIKTFSGRSLRLALDHPVLTGRGWVEAAKLTTDDVVAEVHTDERSGTATITVEEARLLGYLIGDGSVGHGACRLTNEDEAVLADAEKCADSLGWKTRRVAKKKCRASDLIFTPTVRWHESTRGPHPVRRWLERHGLLGKNSYTKRVPPAVMAGTQEIIAAFVGAYWSCDGSVSSKDGRKQADGTRAPRAAIHCSSVSRGLIDDMQHLLTRLRIRSRVRRRQMAFKSKKQGDIYTSWELSITTMDGCSKFAERVSLVHAKGALLDRYRARVDFDHTLNADPVVAVEASDPVECRCLTVEDDHSFTCEDIAVHNSVLEAVLWPAWVWTWWPRCQFLFGSYAAEIATRDSVRCRAVIESDWYRRNFSGPDKWTLRSDQNAKHHFMNTLGGERFSTGIGGTGRRAHLIGVDDPLQREEAHSKAARDEANGWIGETLSQRFVDPKTGGLVLIQQRLHEEDPSGYMISGGGCEVLSLPSISVAEDRCVTYHVVNGKRRELWRDPREGDGEPLFPARFPLDVLEGFKAPNALGEEGFAAQHQQRPTKAGGNMFRIADWRFWKPDGIAPDEQAPRPRGCYAGPARAKPAQMDRIIISVDATFKETTDGSYVAMHVWGAYGADRFLLDRVHERMDFDDTVQALLSLIRRWPEAREKVIEAKANGDAIISTLEKRHGISGIVPESPGTENKEIRARAMLPYHRAGNLYLPDGAPWLDEYIQEHAKFPKGKTNDDVDAQSQALKNLESEETSSDYIMRMG